MHKMLLFGASGNLGRQIARVASERGHEVTAVVRSPEKAALLRPLAAHCIVADVCGDAALNDICAGQEVIISALGKSVSPTERSKASFQDVDLHANTRILEAAKSTGVRKFVYVSALHAERYPQLTYFRVHHQFSERLRQSGINYSIIKPPALFSAYAEMIDMARKGRLVSMGKGDRKTNPIAEADLAAVCLDAVEKDNTVTEAGGLRVYTRLQLLHTIQQAAAPDRKVRTLPIGIIKTLLPLTRLLDRNLYDKMAFFTAVMQQDTLAPQVGPTSFESYIKDRIGKVQVS